MTWGCKKELCSGEKNSPTVLIYMLAEGKNRCLDEALYQCTRIKHCILDSSLTEKIKAQEEPAARGCSSRITAQDPTLIRLRLTETPQSRSCLPGPGPSLSRIPPMPRGNNESKKVIRLFNDLTRFSFTASRTTLA